MKLTNPWISQVKYQDSTTDINVASPTLVKLDSGEILAAHDYQGKGVYRQLEGDRYTTSVYRSDDHGLTWELTADIKGSTGGGQAVCQRLCLLDQCFV